MYHPDSSLDDDGSCPRGRCRFCNEVDRRDVCYYDELHPREWAMFGLMQVGAVSSAAEQLGWVTSFQARQRTAVLQGTEEFLNRHEDETMRSL